MARFSRFRIERNQAPVKSAEQNSSVVPVFALPVSDATVLEKLPLSCRSGLWIKLPNLFAIFRVERNHAIGGSGKVQHAINDQWRGLERGHMMPVRLIAAALRFAHVIGPRSFQSADVAAIDLPERGESRAAGISSIEWPLLRGNRGRKKKK